MEGPKMTKAKFLVHMCFLSQYWFQMLSISHAGLEQHEGEKIGWVIL